MPARCRRLPLPAFATALLASLALATPAARAADCAGADVLPTASSMSVVKPTTLCLLNNERGARGLAPLTSDPKLEIAATTYSRAMVDQRFFAHVSPAGQALADRLASILSGAASWDIGENLAWGEGTFASPRAIVSSWMHSNAHRANILSTDFRTVGVGIVNGSPTGSKPASSATYTTEFATIEGASSSPSSSPKAPGHISAAAKRRIKKRCASTARRKRSTSSGRRAYTRRCVAKRLRALRAKAG